MNTAFIDIIIIALIIISSRKRLTKKKEIIEEGIWKINRKASGKGRAKGKRKKFHRREDT